jgi:hypothetical protein
MPALEGGDSRPLQIRSAQARPFVLVPRSDPQRDGRRAASCLHSTPGRGWKGKAKGRPISDDSTALEEFLPERFYSSRWLWHMTVELLLDGRVCLLPWVTHWACLCGRIGSRMERSVDRRNKPIGPPLTNVIREVIERRLAALSDCFQVSPDTD